MASAVAANSLTYLLAAASLIGTSILAVGWRVPRPPVVSPLHLGAALSHVTMALLMVIQAGGSGQDMSSPGLNSETSHAGMRMDTPFADSTAAPMAIGLAYVLFAIWVMIRLLRTRRQSGYLPILESAASAAMVALMALMA